MKYLLIFVIFLASCHAALKSEVALNTWIGHPISQYQLQNGPASYTRPDGDGGTIYTWTRVGVNPYGGYIYNNLHMFVHSDGRIYNWRQDRTFAPPAQVQIR